MLANKTIHQTNSSPFRRQAASARSQVPRIRVAADLRRTIVEVQGLQIFEPNSTRSSTGSRPAYRQHSNVFKGEVFIRAQRAATKGELMAPTE